MALDLFRAKTGHATWFLDPPEVGDDEQDLAGCPLVHWSTCRRVEGLLGLLFAPKFAGLGF